MNTGLEVVYRRAARCIAILLALVLVACEQGGDSGGVTTADASGATVAFTPPVSIPPLRALM